LLSGIILIPFNWGKSAFQQKIKNKNIKRLKRKINMKIKPFKWGDITKKHNLAG